MKKTLLALLSIVLTSLTGCQEEAPRAYFSHKTNGNTVTFINQSRNAMLNNWNFGDGSTSSDVNPKHTYASAGTYEVSLAVYNDRMVADTYQAKIMVGGSSGGGNNGGNGGGTGTTPDKVPVSVYIPSYKVNSIDFEDNTGRYWDDTSKDGPDIYMRIYRGSDELHRSNYRKDNVKSSDLPFTNSLGVTLNNLAYIYTFRLCDYDPWFVDYMFSFDFAPQNHIDECPASLTFKSGKFSVTLNLKWKY